MTYCIKESSSLVRKKLVRDGKSTSIVEILSGFGRNQKSNTNLEHLIYYQLFVFVMHDQTEVVLLLYILSH